MDDLISVDPEGQLGILITALGGRELKRASARIERLMDKLKLEAKEGWKTKYDNLDDLVMKLDQERNRREVRNT